MPILLHRVKTISSTKSTFHLKVICINVLKIIMIILIYMLYIRQSNRDDNDGPKASLKDRYQVRFIL